MEKDEKIKMRARKFTASGLKESLKDAVKGFSARCLLNMKRRRDKAGEENEEVRVERRREKDED